MAKTPTDRCGIVMGLLAKGIYRPWFWQQNRLVGAAVWRQRWLAVCSRFDVALMCDGLERWERERGLGCPPDPEVFADFLHVDPSLVAKAHLAKARAILEVGDGR